MKKNKNLFIVFLIIFAACLQLKAAKRSFGDSDVGEKGSKRLKTRQVKEGESFYFAGFLKRTADSFYRLVGIDGNAGSREINTEPKKPKLISEVRVSAGDESFSFFNLAYLYNTVLSPNNKMLSPRNLCKEPRCESAFNIIVYDSSLSKSCSCGEFVNIDRIMCNPLNNGAVIQFASNDDPRWTVNQAGGQAKAILRLTNDAAKHRKDNTKVSSLGTTADTPANIDDILIGLHENVGVACCKNKIHLSIVAARGSDGSGYREPHTKNCLKSAYEGTLLSAALLSSLYPCASKVFLTIMGGNIFAAANPIEEVISTIQEAVDKYVIPFGLNVTLVYWTANPAPKLLDLARGHNGYICFFNSDSIMFEKGGSCRNLAKLSSNKIAEKLFG